MARTFSKIYAMGGLRLGWTYSSAGVADVMNRVRNPFNVNSAAQAAGIAALDDVASIDRARTHNDIWRPWLERELEAMGLELTPSAANFVLIRFPPERNARAAFEFLKSRGILTRRVAAYGLPEHLRITIGTRGRNARGGVFGQRFHGRTMSDLHFSRVALIGIGLVGSSLAHVLRRDKQRRHDRRLRPDAGDARHGARARACRRSHARSCRGGCRRRSRGDRSTRIRPMPRLGRRIGPALQPGAILTDVGSVKGAAVRDLGPIVPPGVHFIPGHPVAGTEHSGPAAGFAEMFAGRWCILTPLPGTDPAALAKLTLLWESAGMKVEIMEPEHHDTVLAITSHLPHLIAYTIVGTATDLEETLKAEVIKFSASGFRDFTRIAASDPVMWRDVFLSNREAVLEMLQRFTEDLTALQRAIRWGEGDKLEALFTRTRAIRRSIIEAKQD